MRASGLVLSLESAARRSVGRLMAAIPRARPSAYNLYIAAIAAIAVSLSSAVARICVALMAARRRRLSVDGRVKRANVNVGLCRHRRAASVILRPCFCITLIFSRCRVNSTSSYTKHYNSFIH
jgi:hypothetical protein